MNAKLRRLLTVAVCIMMSVASINAFAPKSVSATVRLSDLERSNNGVNLYRAIFFGEGPEVLKFSRVFNNPIYDELAASDNASDANSLAYKRMVSQVVSDIAENHPNFFEEFGDALTTGDPYEVELALSKAEEVTKAALPHSLEPIDGSEQGMCAVFAFALAVWSAAAVVNYAAGVNIETYAFVHHQVKLASVIEGDQGRYSKEKMVADITQAMRNSEH